MFKVLYSLISIKLLVVMHYLKLDVISKLSLIIETIMRHTIIRQILIFIHFHKENEELPSIEEKEGYHKMRLYDPSFLIPLFSYIVRPGKHQLSTTIKSNSINSV